MSSYDLDRGSSGIINKPNVERIDKELNGINKVRLRHYNITEYIITEVVEVSEYKIKIKITDKVMYSNVLPGDNVSINFINEMKEECIINGIVELAQPTFPQFFMVRVMHVEKYQDSRKNRRYAINACANIIDENTELFGVIKNVSYSGFRVFSKVAIEGRKNVKVQMFIDENNTMTLNAGIVRKKQHLNYNEYGFVILGIDQDERKQLESIIGYISERENI